MQFPEELQPGHSGGACAWTSSLNEVQFPEELQLGHRGESIHGHHASMKCSSRRNCSNAAIFAHISLDAPQ